MIKPLASAWASNMTRMRSPGDRRNSRRTWSVSSGSKRMTELGDGLRGVTLLLIFGSEKLEGEVTKVLQQVNVC